MLFSEFSLKFSGNSFPTASTMALVPNPFGICLVINMSMFAVRFFRVFRRWTNAAKRILATSHRFQMVWIYTFRIPAEMINYKPISNWAFKDHVTNSMRSSCLAFKSNSPVTIAHHMGPVPASVICNLNLPHKNCFDIDMVKVGKSLTRRNFSTSTFGVFSTTGLATPSTVTPSDIVRGKGVSSHTCFAEWFHDTTFGKTVRGAQVLLNVVTQ